MPTYIALIRGINVGGNRIFKMADLRTGLESQGFARVRTLLQSGNVVFESKLDSPADVEAQLEEDSASRFRMNLVFFVRSVPEWQAMIRANPFQKEATADPGHLLAWLRKAPISPEVASGLRTQITGPESIHFLEREFFVYYPEGIGDSQLNRQSEFRTLSAVATGRNWNTVLKLDAAAHELST